MTTLELFQGSLVCLASVSFIICKENWSWKIYRLYKYEFLQAENERLSKLLILIFCSEISDKIQDGQANDRQHKVAISRLAMKATELW